LFPKHIERILDSCSTHEFPHVDLDLEDSSLGILDPIFNLSSLFNNNKSGLLAKESDVNDDRLFYTLVGLILSIGVPSFFRPKNLPKRTPLLKEILARIMAVEKSNEIIHSQKITAYSLYFADDYPHLKDQSSVLSGIVQEYQDVTIPCEDLESRIVQLFGSNSDDDDDDPLLVITRSVLSDAIREPDVFLNSVLLNFWIARIITTLPNGIHPWRSVIQTDDDITPLRLAVSLAIGPMAGHDAVFVEHILSRLLAFPNRLESFEPGILSF
jgi:hypothetical protein